MKIPTAPVRMDISDMRRRLGDDEALIAELFRLFLEEYPARLAAVESAVSARGLEDVRRDAHTLKGCASNLSAFGVIEAADALEAIAEHGDVAGLDRHFAKLAF